MKMARFDRSLTAWILYFGVLFSAFACSIGHGQMAGLQLSGLDGQYCSFEGNFGAGADLSGAGIAPINPAIGSGCSLCSTFGALILAALFGLFGLLDAARQRFARSSFAPRPLRYLWPSANPRASPWLA